MAGGRWTAGPAGPDRACCEARPRSSTISRASRDVNSLGPADDTVQDEWRQRAPKDRLAVVSGRVIRLYGIPLSHPVLGVRGMLAFKGLPYRYVELLAGGHPPMLWARGFRGATVPAIRLPDGRRVQGSLAIAQALERLAPLPSLYPATPAARAAVTDAERWGEAVLQPIPRRLIRWGLRHHLGQRRWFADVASPLPAPRLAGVLLTPIVPVFARIAGVNDPQVRQDLDRLRELLDEVDRLIAQGVIGGDELNAADFQIAPSIRVLLAMTDIARLVGDRPAASLARRVVPKYPVIPAALPADWIPTSPSAAHANS
jgi:glutathione S-transferase